MHELGHNLGLLHGGFEHLGYKPNYLSVMNYFFQLDGLIIDGVDGHYDYSRFNLTTLNENDLNEGLGLSGTPEAANYGTKYFDSYGEYYYWKGYIFTVEDINNNIDWNCDGHPDEYSVTANINYDFDNWGSDIYTSTMHGFDDWDSIVFDGGLVGGGMLGEELPLETDMQELIADHTMPSITVEVPESWEALQDDVTFQSYVTDPCGIDWVKYSIREPGGAHGTIIDATYEACAASPTANYRWQLPFDTTELPDAYYVLYVNASDTQGNINNTSVNFSIRNWVVLEMLPNTPASKAGRTIPVKFSLRIVAAVDPVEPFVRNEDLTIKIYDISTPWNILQQSIYGTGARDYRINSTEEQYITNFHTLKTPTFYVVEIWRGTLLIGNFGFLTIK